MKSLFVFAVVACASSSAVYAYNGATDTKISAEAEDTADDAKLASNDDKMVCRKAVATGSRLAKKKTCMTQRDWNRLQDGTREGVDGFTRGGTGGAAQTGG